MTDLSPMIIDSFAGGGGASTGIEMALGRSPDVAINHNEKALALHAANHPETLHLNSNIRDVDPLTVTKGRHVGLLWASPDCKHFSKAKGGKPKDRNIRDLAWVVVRWAKDVKPDVILLENVEEFRTWGPICDAGKPIKGLEGVIYELWCKSLKEAGYKLQWKELRGCDYGDPTIRKRYFMVARRDGRPIVWPKPTHGDPNSAGVKSGKLQPWRTAAECIDWSLPCPSIFDTVAQIKEKHGLAAKRPLAENTMARVARGLKRYVLDAERPFLVQNNAPCLATFYGHTGGRSKRAADIAEPLRTVTVENRHALVAPSITRFNSGATGQDMREPLATITANSFIKRPGGAAPLGLIAPVLTYAQHGGRNRSVTEPHHTICANTKDQNAVLVPSLVGCGGRAAQSRPRGGYEPLATLTTKADVCLSSCFIAQHNGTRSGFNPGRSVDQPISTLTRSGSHQNVVAPWFVKYYGTGDGARLDEPCHTITARDRFGHTQADLASVPSFGPEHEAKARAVADLMRAHGYWDGGAFVTLTIDGETFVIVDIGMRMLTPRELFTAQGFPSDYVIEGVWTQSGDDWTWVPFTKSVQVSGCGNSVCPGVARALVDANCNHLKQEQGVRDAG